MQADQTFEIFAGAGLTTKVARDEELDATVVIGSKASFSLNGYVALFINKMIIF